LLNTKTLSIAIRTGRTALGWSQTELAQKAGVSIPTVARVEQNIVDSKYKTIGLLIDALEKGGIKFEFNKDNLNVTIPI
jgi:predicted transcriptional regulator